MRGNAIHNANMKAENSNPREAAALARVAEAAREVRKRLTRAVVDFCTGARDDVASVSSSSTGTRSQSMNFGLGKKAHRFAATFHGSNSSTRLIR